VSEPVAEEEAIRAAHLLRLYVIMQRLTLIAETTTLGGVARAARESQRDLWPLIAHFGGSRESYGQWQLELRTPRRSWGEG
jgi:hypothetical protein